MKIDENEVTNMIKDENAELHEMIDELQDNQSELFNRINTLERIEAERQRKKELVKDYFQIAFMLVIIALAFIGLVSLTSHFMGW